MNRPGIEPQYPGPRNKGSKMVLDASLLNTQYNKVRTKGKVVQSRERSSALFYTSVVANEKRSFWVALDHGCQL